ncbi:MAG TPA: phosphatidylinositol mannoside acyltransferase [Acidimicrobiales bacterium]|nr:phosphatidylinositol mannoside acyltransferase [Acidimicrobiales bacterium]
MDGPATSELRAQATYLIYRGLGTAMQRLPEPVAEVAATAVGMALTMVRRRSRAAYGRNIRRVLGANLSDAEVRAWTRRAFLNYARYWLEGSRLPAVPAELVQERMMVESGYEHLVAGMEAGQGVILALPHLGRWEWGGAWLNLQGYPMTAVAETVEPPKLYDWFVAQRRALGLSIIALGPDAGGVLLRTLRAGGLVGLLCDRDIVGNGVEVEFFGERTTLPAGPATLALRTGAVLLPTAVYGGPGRDHSAVIMAPVATGRTGRLRADVTRVTQQVAHDLEQLIRRAPDQWYLFQPNWPSDRGEVAPTPAAGSAGPAPTDDGV